MTTELGKPKAGERRTCKGCSQPIMFILDDKGVLQPLDLAAPVFVVQMDMTNDERAIRTSAYVSHFSTCPKRDQFSKSRRA